MVDLSAIIAKQIEKINNFKRKDIVDLINRASIKEVININLNQKMVTRFSPRNAWANEINDIKDLCKDENSNVSIAA